MGKPTLPGPFKLLRSGEALIKKETIVFEYEDGEDAMVTYFNGLNIEKPFGVGQDDGFLMIKARIRDQWNYMPLNLTTKQNHNYPASKMILDKRRELLRKYAPKKNTKNY